MSSRSASFIPGTGNDVSLFAAADAVGVGLTLINTRAVLEALFGVKSGFVRTRNTLSKATSRSAWR